MSTALATFAKQNRGVLSRIASELGVKRAAVCKWQKRIPPERVLELERVTGISRSALRPDLYPVPDGGPLASAETAISSVRNQIKS